MSEIRRITYDCRDGVPQEGDLLWPFSRRTLQRTATEYLIVGVREVKQREARPFRRFVLGVIRITLSPKDPRHVWPLYWYGRRGMPRAFRTE